MNDAFKTWADSWPSTHPQSLASPMWLGRTNPTGKTEEPRATLDEQFSEVCDAWRTSIEKWTEFAKDGLKPGSLSPEALREMFAPGASSGAGAFDSALRHALEGPRYAAVWDQDRKLLELQQRAMQRDKDALAYQAIVQKAWAKAFERFSASFSSAGAEQPHTWRGVTDRWLQTVNDTLIEAYRSDEFLEAQRCMLRSACDYRLQERKVAEAWCEASHVPTRTEMDEVQRTVTELKRELRALRRQVSPPPVTAAAVPAERSTPSAKRIARPTTKKAPRSRSGN
jgi:hypothetical protein